MSPVERLMQDVAAHDIDLPPAEWRKLRQQLTETQYAKRDVIFSQAQIADRVLFVSAGIAASEQAHADGSSGIARFFEAGHLCTNLTSAMHRAPAEDTLVAITDVEGVIFPLDLLLQAYLDGVQFGRYVRLKLLETLAFDKEVICAKTHNRTEDRYRFLGDRHARIIEDAPAKCIAQFIGITPQGLSRFLRKRRQG